MLQIGARGVSDAVIAEVDAALEHHELIKVKIAAADREARDAMISDLVEPLRGGTRAADRQRRHPLPT